MGCSVETYVAPCSCRSVIGALEASESFFSIQRGDHVARDAFWRIGEHVQHEEIANLTKCLREFRDELDKRLGRDGSILRGERSDCEVRSCVDDHITHWCGGAFAIECVRSTFSCAVSVLMGGGCSHQLIDRGTRTHSQAMRFSSLGAFSTWTTCCLLRIGGNWKMRACSSVKIDWSGCQRGQWWC